MINFILVDLQDDDGLLVIIYAKSDNDLMFSLD